MFKNDDKMPLFSVTESDAGIKYMNLLLEISDMKASKMNMVRTNGTEISMQEPVRLREQYRQEFMQAVETEAKRLNPDVGEGAIKLRARDILNSMMDTSHLSSNYL
jgi:hypothetical protein